MKVTAMAETTALPSSHAIARATPDNNPTASPQNLLQALRTALPQFPSEFCIDARKRPENPFSGLPNSMANRSPSRQEANTRKRQSQLPAVPQHRHKPAMQGL